MQNRNSERDSNPFSEDEKTIYQQKGFESREEYLYCIAKEYGHDIQFIKQLTEVLGYEEDFDGLLSVLDDYKVIVLPRNDTRPKDG